MKILGTGTYACVLKLGSDRVFKVFISKKEQQSEWDLHTAIQRIDPGNEFSVSAVGRGYLNPLHFPLLTTQSAHDFSGKTSVGYIAYEYGGETLGDGSMLVAYTVVELLRFFRPLFKGLRAMRDADVLHFDIKGENLVFTPEKGLRFIDFGFASEYADFCRDSCVKYAYHPVECVMQSYLFGAHGRTHPPAVYHSRLQDWLKTGTALSGVDLCGALDVLGYAATPDHAGKLLDIFRVGAIRLRQSESVDVDVETMSDEDLTALFWKRVVEFGGQPFEDAWRTMVVDNHERQSRGDVFALGIQLGAAFWNKHRHEKELGNTSTKIAYLKVLHLVRDMTCADVEARLSAAAALARLDDLLTLYGPQMATPVTGSKQGPSAARSAADEQGGHVSLDASTNVSSSPTLASMGT